MDGDDQLARAFEDRRPRLRSVAHRILGSSDEAEDAVQEAWIRLQRSDAEAVENLDGWLTTVVGRICLDMLRARNRRAELLDEHAAPSDAAVDAEISDPEHAALLADSLGLALLVILDRLEPDERLAFVLHDMFAVPFADIAPIVGRSPAATRQLASRARRRVHGAAPLPDLRRQHKIVDAFLSAARNGEFERLLALLAPDVAMRADDTAVRIGAAALTQGAHGVASVFSGGAEAARVSVIDGSVGAVWQSKKRTIVAFDFTVEDGRITAIDLVAEPDRLRNLDIVVLDG
ncbi:sigma-70 family RNA polymerase sigma factor [Streptomyces boncukensis]|uniref:Sigma-70 family RNA polymerase sigma factor n=1 Tax=Streptomyces boncukensis TaxID=2711219 RepID=A0A6G4X6V1_9ACTN|nr:sigma-70 family RNA polymerase sigma factor [Streptomyces boncukensis]NGO72577.1 sigma-70 family RNA polymerase sigma factor [Streptomyces boncukensis]